MSSLALAVPLALCAVVLLQRACPSRPLAALAAGQVGVHAALAVSSACAGGHSPHLLMTYAHVAAVVFLRASWDRAALSLEDAVRSAGRHVPRLRLIVPTATATPTTELFVLADEPDVTPLRLQHLPAPTGRRGPPAPKFSPTPA
jgi:hypothetical protein